jgi:hypothetical protein
MDETLSLLKEYGMGAFLLDDGQVLLAVSITLPADQMAHWGRGLAGFNAEMPEKFRNPSGRVVQRPAEDGE